MSALRGPSFREPLAAAEGGHAPQRTGREPVR